MATPDKDVILLVEDDPNDQILIRRSFTKASTPIRIVVANDGDEALSYLTAAETSSDPEKYPLPRVVVLDLKLPSRSGIEVLTWVRRHPTFSQIPVVILSSSDQDLDIKKAYESGVNSYIVKPVDLIDLEALAARLADYCVTLNEMAIQPFDDRG